MKASARLIWPVLIVSSVLLSFDLRARAQEKPAADATQAATEARLGIGVSPLPELLTSHLPDVIGKGRGVLVSEVVADSPAAKAGLQKHDVLVRYGDQDLYSPEQLVKRVRNDAPGNEVQIEYVRAGKLNTTQVKLGEEHKQAHIYSDWPGLSSRFDFPWSPLRPKFWTETQDSAAAGTEWTSFESLSVIKNTDGTYTVRIEFKDGQGASKGHEFQGTRQEIRDAIEAASDLPQIRKDQLLRTLDDRGRRQWSGEFFPRLPRWDRELFNWPDVDF